MSNLSQFFGGSLYSGPLIWVRDVKDTSVGGGYYGSTQGAWRVKDINRIMYNSISGASLTNDGTTSSAVGTVGTQGIVNNPASGTHNASTHVTLPSGTYLCRAYAGLSPSASGVTQASIEAKLYNKSDGADIQLLGSQSNTLLNENSNFSEVMFDLSATKNVDFRGSYASNGTLASTQNDLGQYLTTIASVIDRVYLDAVFFKIA